MPKEVSDQFSRQVGFAGTRYQTHTVFIFMHSITIYNLVLSSSDETSAEELYLFSVGAGCDPDG